MILDIVFLYKYNFKWLGLLYYLVDEYVIFWSINSDSYVTM